MRFDLRLLAALWLSIVVVLGTFAYVSVERERTRLSTELERRAWLLGEGLKEAVEPLIDRGSRAQIDRIVQRFGTPARGVAVYDRSGTLIAATSQWAAQLRAPLPAVPMALADIAPKQGFQSLGERATYYYAVPLVIDQRARGVLVILSDATHIDRARWELAQQHLIRFAVLVAVLSLVTLFVVRRSVTHPLNRLADWARQLRAGQPGPPPPMSDPALFGPLASEVRDLARSLAKARVAIAEEARLRLRGEAVWTEERLKQFVRAPPRRAALRGVEPRAGEPRAARPEDRGADAGQRPRHGDGARAPRVRRRVGGPRQRRRRPRGRGRPPHRGSRPTIRATRCGGCGSPRRRTATTRVLERGAVAALPHRAHAAVVPARGLGAVPGVNRKFADALLEEMAGATARRTHPGLPLRALAARSSRASGPTRAWPSSGTSRGRTSRRSGSAPGRTSS